MFTAIELIGEAIAGATIVASCGLNYLKVAAKIKDNERWLKAPLYDADGKVVPQNTSTAIAPYTTSYGPSLLNKSTPTIFPKKVKCIDGFEKKLLPGKIYTAVNDTIDKDGTYYYLEEIDSKWYKHRFEDVKEEVKPPPTIYGHRVSEAKPIPNAKLVWSDKSQEYITNSDNHENVSSYIIDKCGAKLWHLNGKLHRTDGPAVELVNGDKSWYLNGEYHRTDGPACEYANGNKYWYLNGKCHRTDGPAIEDYNGSKWWYLNGQRHRIDGPAVELSSGAKYWFINGINYSEKDFNAIYNQDIENHSRVSEDANGDKSWYLNGEYHRTDGPAVELASGRKEWWINGKEYSEKYFNTIYNYDIENHRDITCGAQNVVNAPPVESTNGDKHWYLNGKYHRTDGPAIEYANGSKCWFLNGEQHRTDGPAIEYVDGAKYWYLNGKCHRTDGPAVEHANGNKYWFLNDKRHRADGPAIEHADGSKEWWFKGVKLSEEEHKRLTDFNNYFADVDKPASFEEKQKIVELENIELHEYPDGKTWCIKGTNVKHRVFGPAVQSGGKEWWFLYGKEYSESTHKSVIHNRQALHNLKFVYWSNKL